MLTTNLNLVRKSLNKEIANVDIGSRLARDEMMRVILQLSKKEFRQDRKSGIPKAGGPPVVRTGNLRNSIHGEKFNLGFAKYSAIVGPGMVYGRAVELGGKYSPASWKGTQAEKLGFPYLAPAYKKFVTLMPEILAKYVLHP